MKKLLLVNILVLGILLTGCAKTIKNTQDVFPQPRPLGQEFKIERDHEIKPYPMVEMKNKPLSLKQTLGHVLLKNPELAAYSWEMRVQEANVLQAGKIVNPELDIEYDNFSGSQDYSGNTQSETTISLSQLVEIGGKRKKRIRAASLQSQLAGWDFESKRLDVLTATTNAFIEVLAAQMQLKQAKDLVIMIEHFYHTVSERVKAGESSPIEETRARITLSSSQVALGQAKITQDIKRKKLALMWGEQIAKFDHVVGNLAQINPIPSEETLVALLNQNPDIARWETEYKLRMVELSMEQAKAIPDVTIAGGYRKFKETNDNAYVVGVSIPLPFFNRNQGGIAAAKAAQNKTEYEHWIAQNQITANFSEQFGNLHFTYTTAITLKEQIIPAAIHSFKSIEFGYRAGKFGFLDVLDAQRTLFEVQGQYIEALKSYHLNKNDIERLIGESLEHVTDSNTMD